VSGEADHANWFADAPVRRRATLRCDGYFVEPVCEPGCCQPFGPFRTEAAARSWTRRMATAQASADTVAIIELSVEADLLRDAP
jgi:hypothetical protein